MLSAESSTGSYPVEAVTTMATIAATVESRIAIQDYEHDIAHIRAMNGDNNDELAESAITIAKATTEACKNLPIKAVIVLSQAGFTARMLSRQKISQPIYTFVPDKHVARVMNLSRGLKPYTVNIKSNDRDTISNRIIEFSKDQGLVNDNDLVAIVIGANVFSGKSSSVLEIQKV